MMKVAHEPFSNKGIKYLSPFLVPLSYPFLKYLSPFPHFEKSDERILGDGDFVDQVLSVAEEQMEQKNLLISKGYTLDVIAERVCEEMNIDPPEIWKSGKSRNRVAARSLLCFRAVKEFGIIDCHINNFTVLSVVGVLQYAFLPLAL